jgi:hypothetical protein
MFRLPGDDGTPARVSVPPMRHSWARWRIALRNAQLVV